MKKYIKGLYAYILLVALMILVINAKESYHMDEIYTYGLSNNIGDGFMSPKEAPYTYEPAVKMYTEYMIVEEGENFELEHVWNNQEDDVHPPLYYMLIYLVSFMMKGRFSRWIAGSINIVFMILTFWIFHKMLKLYEVKNTVLCELFFVLNPALLNAVTFFRMYVVAMFEVTLLTYLILKYRKNENRIFYVLLGITSILGALTHYYVIVYLFFLSICYGIYLIIKKKWDKVIKYILTMGVAGTISYLIFPAMITHMFGGTGRSGESIENLQENFSSYFVRLKAFWRIVDKEIFGGFLLITITAVLIIFVLKYGKKDKVQITDIFWEVWIGLIPAVLYFFLVAKIAVYNADRYIMPIFVIFILYFLVAVQWLFKTLCVANKKIYTFMSIMVCAVLISCAWNNARWPYLYQDSKAFYIKMESFSDAPGLYITDEKWKVPTNFMDVISLNSITYFGTDIGKLESMEELKKSEEFILYIISSEKERVIDKIYEMCPQINEAKYLGKSGYSEIYYLN